MAVLSNILSSIFRSNTIVTPPFVPTDLGSSLLRWFDTADPATITSAGSPARVSQWLDKSSNADVASQSTGSVQPATGVDSLNGKNLFTLATTNRLFTLANPVPITDGYILFALVNTLSATTGIKGFTGGSSGTGQFSARYITNKITKLFSSNKSI